MQSRIAVKSLSENLSNSWPLSMNHQKVPVGKVAISLPCFKCIVHKKPVSPRVRPPGAPVFLGAADPLVRFQSVSSAGDRDTSRSRPPPANLGHLLLTRNVSIQAGLWQHAAPPAPHRPPHPHTQHRLRGSSPGDRTPNPPNPRTLAPEPLHLVICPFPPPPGKGKGAPGERFARLIWECRPLGST